MKASFLLELCSVASSLSRDKCQNYISQVKTPSKVGNSCKIAKIFITKQSDKKKKIQNLFGVLIYIAYTNFAKCMKDRLRTKLHLGINKNEQIIFLLELCLVASR